MRSNRSPTSEPFPRRGGIRSLLARRSPMRWRPPGSGTATFPGSAGCASRAVTHATGRGATPASAATLTTWKRTSFSARLTRWSTGAPARRPSCAPRLCGGDATGSSWQMRSSQGVSRCATSRPTPRPPRTHSPNSLEPMRTGASPTPGWCRSFPSDYCESAHLRARSSASSRVRPISTTERSGFPD